MSVVVNIADYRKKEPAPKRAPAPDALSFIRRRHPKRKMGYNYWVVEATENYGTDCKKGQELAREFLIFMGKFPTYGNATLLGCIVDDMFNRPEVKKGDTPYRHLTGIELMFLQDVGRAAICAARRTLEEIRQEDGEPAA